MAVQSLHLVCKKCHYLIPEDQIKEVKPLYLMWRKCHYLIPEDQVVVL